MIHRSQPISRRSFVKAGLAFCATAPSLIPARALGVGGAAPAGGRITVGMIGVGRQGLHANLQPFLHAPHTQVVAVCEVDAWRLERAKQAVEAYYSARQRDGQYRGCTAYHDFREVLARPDIDAVMISTPDHWHVPMAIAAAKAGKDVCCEKPLTRSVAEGRMLADTVRRYGRVFRTDSEFRSHWFFQKACELVRNGRIGKLRRIETGVPEGDTAGGSTQPAPVPEELDYAMWLGPAPEAPYTPDRVHPRRGYDRPGWMRCRDYCDGMITDWGAHLNDIAQWGNGTDRTGPAEVEGTGRWAGGAGLWDVLLTFDVRYRYANGVELHFTNTARRVFVRFEGTEGWLDADYNKRTLTAQPESILKLPTPSYGVVLPLKTEKDDFIDAVRTRGATLADAEVGHRTTSMCLLGQIAIERGRGLRWDPEAERFLNDEIANRMLTIPMRSPWTC